MLLLTRGFYALQSNWLPTVIALSNLALNAALDAVLYRLGTWGIPLATSLVNIAAVAALLVLMRRRTGLEPPGETVRSLARILGASVLATGAAVVVYVGLERVLGDESALAQVVDVGAALAVSVGVYLAGCRALGVRELQALLSLRRRAPGA